VSGANAALIGITSADTIAGEVLNNTDGWHVGYRTGNIYSHAGAPAAPTVANGDIMGVAYDSATRTAWFRNASGWLNSGDPVAGTNGLQLTAGVTPDIPALGFDSQAATTTINFGASAFAYTPPTGFSAI
jgi:hypothetical protein